MRKLLILALAGLLAFLPLAGGNAATTANTLLTAPEAQQMADTLGCDASVNVIYSNDLNGAFMPAGSYGPYFITRSQIFVIDGPTLDHESARMILLHEIGHCIDYQDDGIRRDNYPWAEWFADEYAVENAARFGINPEALYRDLADFAKRFGPRENPNGPHGPIAGRLLHLRYQIDKRGGSYQGG